MSISRGAESHAASALDRYRRMRYYIGTERSSPMEPSFALPLADIAARSRLSRAYSALPHAARSAVQAAPAPVVVAGQGCTYVRAVTPRVTLQTIADRLGVSRMTVSNVFSRPDQLSDELRLRVLLAAEELGYVGPDPTARGSRADDGSDRRAAHRCALLRLQRRGRRRSSSAPSSTRWPPPGWR